jgi:hypothetical protein
MNSQDGSDTLVVICTLPCRANNKLSDASSSPPFIASTPSMASESEAMSLREQHMNDLQESVATQTSNTTQQDDEKHTLVSPTTIEDPKADGRIKTKTPRKGKVSHKLKQKVHDSSSSGTSSSESSSDSDESSEDERYKEKRRLKKAKSVMEQAEAKKKKKQKQKERERMRNKKNKSRKIDLTSEDESSPDTFESSSDSDSDFAIQTKRIRHKIPRSKTKNKNKKSKHVESCSEDSYSDSFATSSSSDTDTEEERAKRRRARAKAKRSSKKSKKLESCSSTSESLSDDDEVMAVLASPPELHGANGNLDTQVAKVSGLLQRLKAKQASLDAAAAASSSKVDKPRRKNGLEFKRVDQVFDMQIHDWKLVESNTDQKDDFDCVFTVRRRLDWEGKYVETQLDIKSKHLRGALQEVFGDCKSVSLVEDTPQLDPRTLFHYYGELKTYVKTTLKPNLRKAKRSKERRRLKQQMAQCRLLLSYVDEDFTATRKALKPMLKAGTITYDLVWALFKPNTVAFTPTYHNKDDPRCFKVSTVYESENWMTGIKSWFVDGKYLEYDGKWFGLGDHQVSIQAFKGHKKITSLAAYPLKYHKNAKVSWVCSGRLCNED